MQYTQNKTVAIIHQLYTFHLDFCNDKDNHSVKLQIYRPHSFISTF